MKGKIALIFTAIVVLAFAIAPQANAQSLTVYGYSDKVQYGPGDSGSIKFWVINNDAIPITIDNVTIEFPWFYPGLGGNYTISGIGATLTKGQNWTSTQSFTIPNDGRTNRLGSSSSVSVTAYYEYSVSSVVSSSSYLGYVSLNVAAAPYPFSVEGLQTLMTLNIIMMLVAAIIIAVAIFVTKRTPKGTPSQ